MTFNVRGKYSLEVSINNIPLKENENILEKLVIHESIHQSLPTLDLTIVNLGNLIESNPLTDGSSVDLTLIISQSEGQEEEIHMETLLWSYEVSDSFEGARISLHCLLSAPDFLEGRIESVDGSSLEVFKRVAERSKMSLVSDPSIDRQVWIRSGIRGNHWLNQVINRSWSSPKSVFVYAVTRDRELLRYNLDERAVKEATWTFIQERENRRDVTPENVVRYKYPSYRSQSGILNSFFGYGRKLSTFSIDKGEFQSHQPSFFTKRTDYLNLNQDREVPQRYESLGFNNDLNVHENYFNAYAQNMRLKSLYSFSVELASMYFRPVKLLDRVTYQNMDEVSGVNRTTFAGDYFVEKISTLVTPTSVIRKFVLVREGYNVNKDGANNSK